MKHKLDFDDFIKSAVYDAFCTYTLDISPERSNLSRVATLAAADLVKNYGPELASVFREAIKAEMEAQLDDLKSV
jgi:hypothetical protein